MLDISKVVLPSGQEYTFEDSVARAAVAAQKDYENLDNLPMIEGVKLVGNQTFPALNMNSLSNAEIEALLRNADLSD